MVPPEIRARLAALCRSKRTRVVGQWSAGDPSRWMPNSVADPQTLLPFTEVGAWDFAADSLEAGVTIEEVVLEKPPGATGYVIKVAVSKVDTIYIKLRLRGNLIVGRSFHYSDCP